MKKIGVALLIVGIFCLVGYLGVNHFLINRTSDLDNKTIEEQQEVIIHNQEFKDLPEVVALINQLSDEKQTGHGLAQPQDAVRNSLSSARDESSERVKKEQGPSLSQAEIESQLRQKLLELQAEYTGKLYGLVSSAKKEYQMVQSGKAPGSKKGLAQKYMSLAQGLEAQCDARVYATIAYANNQLVQYGYKSSVPNEAKSSYLRAKSQMRQRLVSKI